MKTTAPKAARPAPRKSVVPPQRSGPDQIDGFLLRVFVAVMEERSVSRAALRLNLPQPTVSAALARLRRVLGDKLLLRGRREMVPTDHALGILDQASRLVGEMEALCASGAVVNRPDRSIAIGTFDYVGPHFVPTIIAEVLRTFPGSPVHVHSLSIDLDHEAALENGELDIVVGNWTEPPDQLKRKLLFSDDVVCYVRRGHPLAKRGFSLADYVEADHVGLIPHQVDRLSVIDSELARRGLRRHLRAILPSFSEIAQLLAQSDCVFTTSRCFGDGHGAGLPLVAVKPPLPFPPINFYLLWHERSQDSPAGRALRQAITRAVKPPRGARR
jgi:DNA-binding transcriptional LysR family regulator